MLRCKIEYNNSIWEVIADRDEIDTLQYHIRKGHTREHQVNFRDGGIIIIPNKTKITLDK